jgi:hypothetical protein
MRKVNTILRCVSIATVILVAGLLVRAQKSELPKVTPQYTLDLGSGHTYHPMDDEYLEWPLAPADKAYASIDGRQLKKYDAEIVAIRERYRDQGHQFWGTITGTSSDVETQKWVTDKFKQIGLDVRVESHDLPPQWIPNSWEITATANGKTLQFPSAFPVNNIPATPAQGLDLEAVYVGTGSEADFAGRDVRGKGVIIYNNARNHANYSALTEGAALRAEQKGAAAVILIYAVPGNIKAYLYRMWPNGANVPTFSIGLVDGLAVRDLIGQTSPGNPARMKVRIDVPMVPNLKTATIFGTLPGMTNETIYIDAHRDAVFDGAVDNASGLSAMMGLAEYFAKVPKEQRRRTIVFVATTGHHNDCKANNKIPCSFSIDWMDDHHDDFFKNTALMINLEHLATAQVYMYNGPVRRANMQQEANFWYVKGSDRIRELAYNTYRGFGVPIYADEDKTPLGDMSSIFKYSPAGLNLINLGLYSHTDGETLDVLPWTGLQSVTRAFAKIITETNRMDVKDLQQVNTGSRNEEKILAARDLD